MVMNLIDKNKLFDIRINPSKSFDWDDQKEKLDLVEPLLRWLILLLTRTMFLVQNPLLDLKATSTRLGPSEWVKLERRNFNDFPI